MKEEEKTKFYTIGEEKEVIFLTLEDRIVIGGFPHKDNALSWLLSYLLEKDQQEINNARVEREREQDRQALLLDLFEIKSVQ